jgi:mannose-6-phosphate isomerase-like protein (cupin superfamily)
MPSRPAIRVTSYRSARRLIPRRRRGLRASSVVLRPGGTMDWHSTQRREELLIAMAGTVHLEADAGGTTRRVSVKAGQCAWLPPHTRHRVVNRFRLSAAYVYVTGAA